MSADKAQTAHAVKVLREAARAIEAARAAVALGGALDKALDAKPEAQALVRMVAPMALGALPSPVALRAVADDLEGGILNS